MEEKVARLQASLESNETTKGEVTSGLTESGKPDQQDSDYDFTTVAQFQQQIVNQKSKINSLSLQLTNAQDHIKELTEQLDDSKSELIRAHEREKLNEEHNERLSSTVSKLVFCKLIYNLHISYKCNKFQIFQHNRTVVISQVYLHGFSLTFWRNRNS